MYSLIGAIIILCIADKAFGFTNQEIRFLKLADGVIEDVMDMIKLNGISLPDIKTEKLILDNIVVKSVSSSEKSEKSVIILKSKQIAVVSMIVDVKDIKLNGDYKKKILLSWISGKMTATLDRVVIRLSIKFDKTQHGLSMVEELTIIEYGKLDIDSMSGIGGFLRKVLNFSSSSSKNIRNAAIKAFETKVSGMINDRLRNLTF